MARFSAAQGRFAHRNDSSSYQQSAQTATPSLAAREDGLTDQIPPWYAGSKSMQTLIISTLALSLILLGVYAFPIPKASFRAIYSKVPQAVVAALGSFRRNHPPKRFKAGRIVWRYHDAGAGENVILFLHGMGGSGDIWFQQIEALKDRFRCIAVTYPPLPDLDLLRFGILGILDQEKISRVHLVGSSMGGYLAQFLLAHDPGLVRKAMLGNTFPPNTVISRRARMGVRYLPWIPEWAILAGMRRNTARVLYPAAGNSELVKAYLFEQTCGLMRKPDLIARCACLCQSFVLPDPRKLEIPALIVEADDDPLIDEDLRKMMRLAYPSAEVRAFRRAGHFPYLTRPEEYTGALAEFVGG
jgi:pimeloyl-ACP methyl ester carboxylesterase